MRETIERGTIEMIDDPHDPMMGGYTPSKDVVKEKYEQHWDEKSGMFESYWDILMWLPLWIMIVGGATVGMGVWALVKYL